VELKPQDHTWSAWNPGNATHHDRTCSSCGGSDEDVHIWIISYDNVYDDVVCRENTCKDCPATDPVFHDTDYSIPNRTFHRITEGCAFRTTPCTRCEMFPRFIFDSLGAPFREENMRSVSEHRWTDWENTGLGTHQIRRCINCGLQQWRPDNNAACSGNTHCTPNTSVIRNRVLTGGGIFVFRCITVCSACTASTGVYSCESQNPECETHNATAKIEFRLNW
jgi:hypothetical protein